MAAYPSRKRKIALSVLEIIEEALKGTTKMVFPVKPSEPGKTCKCSKCGYWHYPLRK